MQLTAHKVCTISPAMGKLFTRRATFEKILKPRAALIERARKSSALSISVALGQKGRPQVSYFPLKMSDEQ